VTVVFLHPVGLDGNCWQFVTDPRLGAVVRYDLLWHGGRERPPAPLSLETFAEDVLANVEGPLDLVGVSMGGGVAMQAALHWPERVRSVVIACSSAGDAGGAGPLGRAEATEQVGMEGMLDSTLQRWFTPETLEHGGHPAVAYARQRLLSDSPESFAASWRALAGNDAWSRLHLLRAPTTVLHAAADASVSLERNEKLAEKISGARLKIIPGPHMVHLERPEEFGAAVLEHLDWVDAQLGHS
jgi:3-oxoadipate enol-lactonase